MTLISYNNAFPKLFDDFFTRDIDHWFNNEKSPKATLPAVNVKVNEDSYALEVAVPGRKKEDFKIELNQDVLTISSEKEHKKEEKDKEGNYTQREFSYQSFQRSFRLPKGKVDSEKIQARYEDGILHLSLPKKEEAKPKPARQIEIA